jgi:Zn-dependent peptidase ImmA (M78 family)
MKMRVAKNWNPLTDTYKLTKEEIGSQVLSDLAKYRRIYSEKYNKGIAVPLDIDNYVQELWGFNISFEIIPQDSESEDILGYLRPETRQIVIDEGCTNQRRISFTVAHEAGHLSLHGPLFTSKDGLINGWKHSSQSKNDKQIAVAHLRREWQANVYAGALLAPQNDVHSLLSELGLIREMVLASFSLDDHFSKFEQRFGLSRQALEIRLNHLGVPFRDARYTQV